MAKIDINKIINQLIDKKKANKMARNNIDKNSSDYQFGVVLTKLEFLDEK